MALHFVPSATDTERTPNRTAGPMPLKWPARKPGRKAKQTLDDACDHELTQTSAGAGIVRVSCSRCHGVELKPGGWMPSSGNVKARREIGTNEPL